jgi:two-component sensor histidine kinase
MASPFDLSLPHASLIITLGVLGCLLWFYWMYKRALPSDRPKAESQFSVIVFAWMACQFVILFTYVWGRPNHPASGRLILAVDVFFSFAAAWAITVGLQKVRQSIPILVCVGLFLMSVPAAAEGRFLNQLTLIRQAAAQWKFFEKIDDKRIMIVTDRPGLFTVMDYGTVEIAAAKQNSELLNELNRRLFNDLYVIQEIDLETKKPKPEFELWPDTPKESLLEFQNDASSMVRISKIKRP